VRRLLARISLRGWSLRTRLLVGVVGLVAVALATTGTIGIAVLRGYLVHQLDQQLAVGSVRISNFAPPPGQPVPSPPATTRDQLPTPFVFADLSTGGAVLRVRGGQFAARDPEPVLSGIDVATVRRQAGRAFTVPSSAGGAGFRVRAVERPDGSGIFVVGISLQGVDATVHRIELITWIVALSVLAVLIAVATVAVRLGLRPLATVERAAQDIAAGDLSRRVAEGPPGTEIGRLSSAFNSMITKIESAVAASARSQAALRQFIADASHELRTPLTTVRGYAELARKRAFPDDAAEAHAMERIEAEASRMGGLVDDLLLLAHLDQDRPLRLAKVDLAALTADAVADARVRTSAQRVIDFAAPEAPVHVDVDADRMRQVLVNLLGNATTHTPEETRVRVALGRDGAAVRLEVADEGPGLPADQVARLFERFYRVDPGRSRARGGSGLGLAIVAAIVHASRGTVTCTSAPGQGTRFVVRLPAHSSPSADLEAARR
jgi:two-component system OmpR family sensor kinase